jgi:O-antigen/teichoic acid export membrane protein
LGTLAGIKLLTAFMGTEKFGQLALGLTLAGLFNLFFYGPIAQWILRYFSVHRERDELCAYLGLTRRVWGAVSATVIVVGTVLAIVIHSLIASEWALLVVAAAIYAISAGTSLMLSSLLSAVRRRKVVALHQGADAWIRALSAVLILSLFGNSGHAALLGFGLGTMVIGLSQVSQVLRDKDISRYWRVRDAGGTRQQNHAVMGDFRSFVGPFVYFAIFGVITQYADRWILQGWYGEKEVGIYAAMYQIANAPMSLLFGVVNQLAMPILFEHAGAMRSKEQERRSRGILYETVGVVATVLVVPVVIAYVYGAELITWITTPEYAEQHTALWVLVLGLSVFNVAQLLSLYGFSRKASRIYVGPKCVHAATFLLFSVPLAASFGILGVSAAIMGSSVAYLLSVIAVNRVLQGKSTVGG